MLDKILSELVTEIKKIRVDLDAIKTAIDTIAVNTTPADDSDPDDSEPAET